MNGSPLGPYTYAVAALASLAIIGAAVAVHVGAALGLHVADTSWLDQAAFVAIGIVLGGSAGVKVGQNGALTSATAAHARLDAIGAPPATDSQAAATAPGPGSVG